MKTISSNLKEKLILNDAIDSMIAIDSDWVNFNFIKLWDFIIYFINLSGVCKTILKQFYVYLDCLSVYKMKNNKKFSNNGRNS